MYKFNPKTKGSGIICAIPQVGECPNKCADCFFQSGRSYLEPLHLNLPNMPTVEQAQNMVVRVNDGNDSNVNRSLVITQTSQYPMKFYNTAIPKNICDFPAPVVLTVNPGEATDNDAAMLDPVPENLMFVRFRANTWNALLMDKVVEYYTSRDIPVVLTFMAYFDGSDVITHEHKQFYVERKRTLNTYWAITTSAWRTIMRRYENNKYVYSCSKIEGELGTSACHRCGNCLREYFATTEKLKEATNG